MSATRESVSETQLTICRVYLVLVTPSAEQTTEPCRVIIAAIIVTVFTQLAVTPPFPGACATPIKMIDSPKNTIAKLKLITFGAVFGCFLCLSADCAKNLCFAVIT